MEGHGSFFPDTRLTYQVRNFIVGLWNLILGFLSSWWRHSFSKQWVVVLLAQTFSQMVVENTRLIAHNGNLSNSRAVLLQGGLKMVIYFSVWYLFVTVLHSYQT